MSTGVFKCRGWVLSTVDRCSKCGQKGDVDCREKGATMGRQIDRKVWSRVKVDSRLSPTNIDNTDLRPLQAAGLFLHTDYRHLHVDLQSACHCLACPVFVLCSLPIIAFFSHMVLPFLRPSMLFFHDFHATKLAEI